MKDDKNLRKRLKEFDDEIAINVNCLLKEQNLSLIFSSIFSIEIHSLTSNEILQKIGETVFGVLDTVMDDHQNQ